MKICLSCEGVTNTAAQRCGHCGAWMLPTDAVHYPVRRGETESGNPLLGTVIDGKYRLQAVLGRGGLGTVFQAMHTGSLMTVALKLLHPRFAERQEYRRALLPEARRAATVTHVHCARLLDVGESEDGAAYLAMELVDGDTLETVMRHGTLAPSQAVEVLVQVAEALTAIHQAGLVHCDLSPRNVMVASRGGDLRVKVLDFGIARSVTMAGSDRLRGAEFAGFVNPVFSAPELLANQDVDARADVYSFGSLAWLLLTGTAPVDDADSRRAAAAVAAGELRSWPTVPGVPRRLQQLVQRCVSHDREQRPASAVALLRELALIRGSRRPAVGRAAVVAAAVAVMATLARSSDAPPPFLSPFVGSALQLADRGSPRATEVQYLPSARLGTVLFHFGGFASGNLRVDMSRDGVGLLSRFLQPEADAAGGQLTVANAQPVWREVLEGMVRASRDGPIDLSFVVPGRATLGSARVRLDDEAPIVDVKVDLSDGDTLTGAARLSWQCTDLVGIEALVAEVTFQSGRRIDLPLAAARGELDLGAALAERLATVEPLGAGEITVGAIDLAGNRGTGASVGFREADLQAPSIVAVTGPAGEPFAPATAELARLRVHLSAAEAGCTLRLLGLDRRELARVPLPGAEAVAAIELALHGEHGSIASGPCWFAIEDAFGNRTEQQLVLTLRRRDLQLEVTGKAPGSVWLGGELVTAAAGGEASLRVAAPFRLVQARVELSRGGGTDGGELVRLEPDAGGGVRCHLAPLPAGGHVLRLELEEGEGLDLHRSTHPVVLRVLPDPVEVRVPAAKSRFLPGLLEAGLLARRGGGYGEGPGWRFDPALRPYVRGNLWVGDTDLVSLPLPERRAANDPLLPEVVPVPGHNVLALELRDVLDRPVRVVTGDGAPMVRQFGGNRLDVVADFWWHDAAPETIGEEILVEYGQPARLRLRFALPFRSAEAADLRLGIAQSEIGAAKVVPDGDGAVVAFELPFEVWSVAAQLSGRPRAEFPEQLERRLDAYVATPAGRQPVTLRLRTTRSTLRPTTLGELGELPPELAAVTLLPVLAPVGPFAEPVPESAPPRALFRSQQAVAVRNLADFLLQDREFCCGEARALVAGLATWLDGTDKARLVHRDDPLRLARLAPGALLPAGAASAPADQPLVDVDFFQAYTLCRLLGVAVGRDPNLFRLPLGCELELAAYAAAKRPSCHGVGATGGSLSMPGFLAAAARLDAGVPATIAASRTAGDLVPTDYGAAFVGLDFGVREWVGDLPHVPGAELLLREWIGDHAVHLARVSAFARGDASPPPDLAAPLRTLGVVRGLALGEIDGLIAGSGARLDPHILTVVPDTVPGVLRTEQLCRDGRDLLTSQRDPRLQHIGFRVAGAAATLSRMRRWR